MPQCSVKKSPERIMPHTLVSHTNAHTIRGRPTLKDVERFWNEWRLSNTPKLSPMDKGHEQPDRKYRVADWVEIHVGKRPDSIGSDGDGLLWQEAIELAACQFARDLENVRQSRVEEEVENVGKRTPSDPMETGCRVKRPSDSPRVISQET